MKVDKLMTTTPISVHLDDTLWTVKETFDHFSFHHLLVVNHEVLCGVISDRDLLKALSPTLGTAAETSRDLATLNKKAHQIMTRKLHTLTPDAGIYDAIAIFVKNEVSCIPIINEKQKPVGIVSWRDILKFIDDRKEK
ncbi:MAG: CBS domain-containing protein [Algicola sp.]|nr:CBS domain-containing protein [Algicola sp.]